MTIYFASDLHLSDQRPELYQAFFSFLDEFGEQMSELYLLGDIFDVWIGDDATTPLIIELQQRLKTLTQNGMGLWIMHGNRDFLLGKRFAKACGGQITREQLEIDIHGRQLLLCHGDELCTDDQSYQKQRKIIRNPLVKFILSHLPLSKRQQLAAKARARSQRMNAEKDEYLMDVNPQAVEAMLIKTGAPLLLHGHTHRPKMHEYQLTQGTAFRLVLGSWSGNGGIFARVNPVATQTEDLIELVKFETGSQAVVKEEPVA